jgi:hypothetical protein
MYKIYIDNVNIPFGRTVMNHMFPDTDTTIEQLIEFAEIIGLKKEWCQYKDLPHFDVSLSMKEKAIKKGAIPIKLNSKKGTKIFIDCIEYWMVKKHGKKY